MPRGKLIHFSNDHIQFIKELLNDYKNPGYTFIAKQLLEKFGQQYSPWSIKNLLQDMHDSPKLYGGDLMQMAAKKVKDNIYKGETMQRQGTKLLTSELSDIAKKGIMKKPKYLRPGENNPMIGGNQETITKLEQEAEELQDELNNLQMKYDNVLQQSMEVLEILKYYNEKLLPVLVQDEEIEEGLRDFMKEVRKEIRGVDKDDIPEIIKDVCIKCVFS